MQSPHKSDLSLQDVFTARKIIAPYTRVTPLVPSPALTQRAGAQVALKLEILQETGSFKARGATNKILHLTSEKRERGVVTASTGNHGRAVSYAAREVGISATVCLSEEVPENKVQAIQALGAEVVVHGVSQDAAFERAVELEAEQGLTMVPPFDDPHVIAGQGTIGLELLAELPELDTALVPLSGGGLISGIALALKSASPGIRVIGVSMQRAPVMYHSLKAGQPIQMDEEETLADSLRGGIGLNNRYTFRMVHELVDDIILLSEEEIAEAMSFAFTEHHLVVEGGGAVGVAALLAGKVENVKGVTAVVLSGGNVGIDSFLETVHPN